MHATTLLPGGLLPAGVLLTDAGARTEQPARLLRVQHPAGDGVHLHRRQPRDVVIAGKCDG